MDGTAPGDNTPSTPNSSISADSSAPSEERTRQRVRLRDGAAELEAMIDAVLSREERRVILVDGFNVLHAVLLKSERESGWWRRAMRERLLNRVGEWPQPNDEIWVAFDGAQPSWSVWAEPVAEPLPRRGTGTCIHSVYVESADDWIVRRARKTPHPDRTVVVTADHGEGNGEHGETTHGVFLYQSVMRVPLIFAASDAIGWKPAAVRVEHAVSNVAIAPTLLALAGIEGSEMPEAKVGSLLTSAGAVIENTSPPGLYRHRPCCCALDLERRATGAAGSAAV